MENSDGNSLTSGVKADTHQSNSQPQSMSDNRPASVRSNRDERVKLLKEKQNEERIKKLEELKESALLAAKLREEQNTRRKKHFEELGKKEDERRRQAEERRRMLEEERKISLQSKFETKKAQALKPIDRKPVFAFGSCTPRLIENNVDGYHWKSQYNLNIPRESPLKSTSVHDLHSQTMEPDRIFCGRRKTDLTPTLPIRRVDGSSRSTSRAGGSSGRIYSSLTRLDNRSLGGQARINCPTIPSKSKSTIHLTTAGKLTRTELLRQALVSRGRESKTSAGSMTPRLPSSMTSSWMTSSVHSQAPTLRPRNLSARKSRPVSVHVTGVSNGEENTVRQKNEKSNSHSPPAKSEKLNSQTPPIKSEKVNSQTPQTKSEKLNSHSPPVKSEKKVIVGPQKPKLNSNKNLVDAANEKLNSHTPPAQSQKKGSVGPEKSKLNSNKNLVGTTPTNANTDIANSFPAQPIMDSKAEPEKSEVNASNENVVVISNSNSDISKSTSAQPTTGLSAESENEAKLVESVPSSSENEISEVSQEQSTVGANGETMDANMPKILTEEEAKIALAEKRRLARELQEKEAARLEEERIKEEARLEEERIMEEERQRLEIEEAERLAAEARQQEEERLRIAIEEQEKRALEEKRKLEEEESARLERENFEREAAKEAERVRIEMEERLKKEEEERLERKRRVEAIMSRTRKKETETAMATTPTPPEETASNEMKSATLNGIQTTLDQSSTRTTINNINNYNNNNDFSDTLIDFGDMIQSPPSSTQSNSSNDIMNSPLQDLLS